MLEIFTKRRHERLKRQEFPAEWRQILRAKFRFYSRLPSEDQLALEDGIKIFLAEKSFEGCGGLAVTDEMRVLIAAHACLLLLRRPSGVYPDLKSILIYPGEFYAPVEDCSDSGIITEDVEDRLGESSEHGVVVLSWEVEAGDLAGAEDGINVALHEFAHQLDLEDGGVEGAPLLAPGASARDRAGRRARWASVMSQEFLSFKERAEKDEPTLLDPYGASDPAEFFAVASEAFFETPGELLAEHPALYAELRDFYLQDPAAWPD